MKTEGALEGRNKHLLAALAFTQALSSCIAVDQFGSRVGTTEMNANSAANNEMLLNIVRASYYQSSGFFTLTQINGGQAETLGTGLPTINIGPHQTQAQQIYSISNSLSSNVTASYQGNPLTTTQFQEAMLAPVSGRWLAGLLRSHPRETVMYAVIDYIQMNEVDPPFKTIRLFNDPINNNSPAGVFNPAKCEELYSNPRQSAVAFKNLFENDDICNFTKFDNVLKVGMQYGLTFDYVAPPVGPVSAASVALAAKPSTSSPDAIPPNPAPGGAVCFDPGLALPPYRATAETFPGCGAQHGGSHSQLTFVWPGIRKVRIQLGVRSANGVIAYLGKLLRDGTGDQIHFDPNQPDHDLTTNGNFLEVTHASSSNCVAAVSYNGAGYCVPPTAYNTAILLDILIQLKYLATSATDLGASFTVRLSE